MADTVKYYITHSDIEGIEHRLNIYDNTYTGESIQIDGRITLTYAETDDALECIRGQGLSVELEANSNLTFNDLWTEEEKTIKVDYKRDNVILFVGWLNPEGFFENYVDTNWLVSFDCVDGLGYLKDLSFVDANGFPIVGRKSYAEILAIALQRTGLHQYIFADIQIRYTGLSTVLDILSNVYANTERYKKDDDATIMDCEEVIRDILEPFGACLTSYNGAWHIYKPNQLYFNTEARFDIYSWEGNLITNIPFDTDLTIGSEWNGFYPHHCSANQKVENKSSLGAYRINYKYGLSQSLVQNQYLYSEGGVSIEHWTINSMTNVLPLTPGGSGIRITAVSSGSEINQLEPALAPIITDATAVEIYISYTWTLLFFEAYKWLNYRIIVSDKILPDATATIYYLQEDLTWGTTDYTQQTQVWSSGSHQVKTPIKPFSGDGYFYLQLYTPTHSFSGAGYFTFNQIRLTPFQNAGAIIGEFHTFQKLDKPSAKVKDVVTVATGDNIADIYEGTIYKNDSITPTETWNRKGYVESKSLLRIMGEETMRLNQLSSRIFSGDVYGYFNYMSTVTISGFDGVFIPIEYSYDIKSNITSAKFRQIYGNEINEQDDDGFYEFNYDYGNTVKPTIKG